MDKIISSSPKLPRGRKDSLKLKKIEEIMWVFRQLDYKYRAIFKLKRNVEKMING
jgi:hypothetical protein